ncbi:MAG: hypothetical protein B5M53_03160 [Candidatus Cloacimonas sp. 4484_209]|nr:MAG: hypothetical protein B5M53_03160 [Candidatus Cloacimonas sp. 4484_209]
MSNKIRIYSLFTIFIISISLQYCAPRQIIERENRDNIYFKNGEEYAGKLIAWKNDTIFFWTPDTIIKIPDTTITSVDFTQKREGDSWISKDDITDPILKNILNLQPEQWYKNGGYVTFLRKREFFLYDDGHSIEKDRVINRILQERGKSVANQKFTYLSSLEKANLLFARGITKDGNVVSIRENAIEDAPYFRTFLLYNDFRQKKFAIPEGRIGSILDYSYEITRKKDSPVRPFYANLNLGNWEPTKTDSVIVSIPNGKKIKYKTRDISEPTIIKKGKNTKYIWVVKNLPGKKRENFAPPYVDIFPRLTFAESTTWQNIDSVISSHLADSLIYPDEIQNIINNLLSCKPHSIVDSLYSLVCREIRFAPVPINASLPIPKSLKTIYQLKYANSLDKTYFLFGLLKKAGIKSSIILTRSKKMGKLVKEVPSPLQFSYAILLVELNGDTIFLDPKNDTYTEGYISGDIQGTEGLVLNSAGKFVKTPVLSSEKKDITLKATLKPDGTLLVEKNEELSGKFGVQLRRLKELTEEEKRRTIEEEVASIYPGAELLEYHLSPLSNLTKNVSLSLKYRIKNFAFSAGRYLFIKLPEINYNATSVGALERELPLFFDTYETITHKVTISIPKGFTVYHIGKNRSYNKKIIKFSSTFQDNNSQIIYTDKFSRNSLLIKPGDYNIYRTCKQLMAEVPQEILICVKKK